MRLPDVKSAMYAAYLLGFESSREGVNGEHGRRPASWYENRDQQISEYLENHRPEEPAFPVPETVCDGRAFQPDNPGMSLRDYFAATALAGAIDPMTRTEVVAKYCYAMADAMMKAREA